MKKTVFLAALQLVVAAALHPAFAVEALTVQGAICDTKGAALKGQQTIECRLYSQGEGGEALWGAAIATLLDTKGVFTIELRDDAGSKIVDSQLGDVLKKTESGELWLGVAVNGGGEMKPRQEIVSVPFAIVGLDSSSAVDFSVSGTARVDRVEVADPEHTDGNFNAVTTDGVLFQRSFTVEGDAAVSGGASISGNLEVGNDVEVGKISAAEGFFGAGAVPVGAIMPWWGLKDELPDGWAICDGNEGTRTPDIRDRFLLGSSLGAAGGSGGKLSVTLQESEVPSHSHTITLNDSKTKSYGWGWLSDDSDQEDFWQGNNKGATATSASVGGGKSHENRPPYRALYFIQRIK